MNVWSSSYIPPPPGQAEEGPYKILLVHAHPNPTSFSSAIADTVDTSATAAGHTVRRISLYAQDGKADCSYQALLTREERASYFSTHKTIDPIVRNHLELMKWCDTIVFVYPTWWMNVPAALKGFLDRTLVNGEAWEFVPPGSQKNDHDPTGFIPKLTNIQRVVGISTYGATFPIVTITGDNGRRMLANAIRPVLHPEATVRWLGLYDIDGSNKAQFLTEVDEMIKNL